MNRLTPILNGYVRTSLIEAVYYKKVTEDNYMDYTPYIEGRIGMFLVEVDTNDFSYEVAYCSNEAAASSIVEEIARQMESL